MDEYLSLAVLVITLLLSFGTIAATAFVLACWRRTPARVYSPAEISIAADKYVKQFDDGALNQVGVDMNQERVANGMTPRYRFLEDVSGLQVQRVMNAR
jgi:hypothetical protein